MARRILRRPRARQDLVDQSRFLAEEGDVETALRFLDSCEESFSRLAERPGIGSPYPVSSPDLEGLRMHPVSGFRNHLVFYVEVPAGIRVLRVLHARRDLPGILEGES